MPTHLTFCHYDYELRRSFVAQNSVFRESSRKNTPKFQFAVQIEIFQENTFFYVPYLIIGPVAQHTHVQIDNTATDFKTHRVLQP